MLRTVFLLMRRMGWGANEWKDEKSCIKLDSHIISVPERGQQVVPSRSERRRKRRKAVRKKSFRCLRRDLPKELGAHRGLLRRRALHWAGVCTV